MSQETTKSFHMMRYGIFTKYKAHYYYVPTGCNLENVELPYPMGEFLVSSWYSMLKKQIFGFVEAFLEHLKKEIQY